MPSPSYSYYPLREKSEDKRVGPILPRFHLQHEEALSYVATDQVSTKEPAQQRKKDPVIRMVQSQEPITQQFPNALVQPEAFAQLQGKKETAMAIDVIK
ncbi:hypothetical protein PoB_003326700 [Plakobranchus ocellatus]|uniref:Zasp-like motif domain-containing protein n=1 Tax=Plakobranchus ocellatus TaxID=259542 RepID=A0AAV4AIM6_9GAST|nr:hypothetical protein PoB_003326700 [Plakobranchus ocellatus]